MKKTFMLFAVFFWANCIFGFNPAEKKFDIGISGGITSPGVFKASWYDDFAPNETVTGKSNSSFMARAIFDYYVLPFLALGTSFAYTGIAAQNDLDWLDNGLHHVNKNDIFILDYCIGIKFRYFFGESFAIKPGFYGGFRSSFSHSPEAREFAMAIDGSVELQYFIKDNVYTYLDFGFITQPYGGIQNIAYVRGGPIFYATAGFGI